MHNFSHAVVFQMHFSNILKNSYCFQRILGYMKEGKCYFQKFVDSEIANGHVPSQTSTVINGQRIEMHINSLVTRQVSYFQIFFSRSQTAKKCVAGFRRASFSFVYAKYFIVFHIHMSRSMRF